MVRRIVLAFAGLVGAGGVVLAAMAAHVQGATELSTAAQFLLLHAAAAVGLAALAAGGRGGVVAIVAACAMLLGAVLFSGDLALRQLAHTKLLWGTAPFGGTIMIVGWVLVVVTAVVDRR